MQTRHPPDERIFAPLMAYIAYRIGQWLWSMRPKYTTEQIAAAVAVSHNPTGT